VNVFLVVAASLPCVAIVRHVRSRLAHDRSAASLPWTFLFGAMSTVVVLALAPLLSRPLEPDSNAYSGGLFQAFVSASLPEEAVKLLVLSLAVARGVVRDRRSGLAHGLAASLGFAAVEMALFAGTKGFGATVLRSLTTLPCHGFLGCVMGRLMGDAVAGERGRRSMRAAYAFLVPVALHTAYDYPLMVLAHPDTPAHPGTWAFALLTTAAMSLLVLGAVVGMRLYREVFAHRLRSVAARPLRPRYGVEVRHAGLVAWSLIPFGGLLASVGGWLVGGILFVEAPTAEIAPNFGRAATALCAFGGALVCFGLAVGVRGLRARRRARQIHAAGA
jgi:hypothetical protein